MRPRFCFIAALLVLVSSMPVRAGERIDRVLALVNGTTITESDVRAAVAFGLVRPPLPGADRLRATLDQLIRRELILGEVMRSAAADVDAARVKARMDGIRSRFPSREAFDAQLAATAMTEARLRDSVEADVRVEDYVAQRFGGVAEPGDAEVAAYYDAHQAEFTSAGRRLTLEEARPAVASRVIDERRRQVIEDWVARLRRRADVTDLYFTSPAR